MYFVSALQITNVLIPNTVTNLEDGAFQMCSNLAGVYFQGNTPSLGLNVFPGGSLATAYYLPATTNWGMTFDILTDGVMAYHQWRNQRGRLQQPASGGNYRE
jgi:hypothetical protein